MTALVARGLTTIDGDLVLDRTFFAPIAARSECLRRRAAEALQRGPGRAARQFQGREIRLRAECRRRRDRPHRHSAAAERQRRNAATDRRRRLRRLARRRRRGVRRPRRAAPRQASPGRYPASCGEREWWVSLLDHPAYVHAMFAAYFREAGGRFAGGYRDGLAPKAAAPFATLESPPLHEIVRDVNKLSNNVMARQVFLTLATAKDPPPATTARANAAVLRWLARNGSACPSSCSTTAPGSRASSGSAPAASCGCCWPPMPATCARNSRARSPSPPMDGTVQRRFQNGSVAGPGAAEDRNPRRRARDRRVRHRRRRPALGASLRSSITPTPGGRRARSISSCNGSIATPRRGKRPRNADPICPVRAGRARGHISGIGLLSLNRR